MMRYELQHQGTELGTGQFACMPQEMVDFEDALQYVHHHPNDDFMRKYLLHLAGQFGPNMTRQLIQRAKEENDRHLMTLMYESCLLNERLKDLRSEFEAMNLKELARYTPLIYVNWAGRIEQPHHAQWVMRFSENILRHILPADKDELGLTIPYSDEAVRGWKKGVVPIQALIHEKGADRPIEVAGRRRTAGETAALALERLKAIELPIGPETQNSASLSPHAIQVQWVLRIEVSTGRNHWQLTGLQTSYGKGLTRDDARASCYMEVAERVSSFASFDSKRALQYKEDHLLVQAPFETMKAGSDEVLNPNDMHLEVPYENQPLYWVRGEGADEHGTHPVYVPAQLVFLFCNLDEISLTTGLPSTGLASGNSLEEAKLHALLEAIERDSERIMPYSPVRRFLLEAEHPQVQDILRRANEGGVQVQLLDIANELGVPCFKAFIEGPQGQIVKGCGANLDGKRAVFSALTEVPYHPSWFHPKSPPQGIPLLRDRDLPDYSFGDTGQDLRLLEALLIRNGYRPIYVNLTREDLDIPVVKAIIPGLEVFSEFDRFSRFSLRQFGHHLEVMK